MEQFVIHIRHTAGEMGRAEGFAAREKYVRGLIEPMGGEVESWFFAHGAEELFVTVEAEPMALHGMSQAINASGSVHIATTPLLKASKAPWPI